jgi:hypothetical protein
VHIIGKDIVRFHAVYWPAFLMSAGLPLPRQIFGHGFLLNRGEKMSKSLGNVVDPMELAERFGVDALRYFLMREVSFGQDGTYSAEAIVTRVNADLANSFGNLAQRTLSFISKNLDGRMPQSDVKTAEDAELLALVDDACRNDVPREFAEFAFSQGLDSWMRAVFACNQYIDAQAPWALRKTDPARMEAVLETLLRAMRALAIAVQPIIPASAGKLLDQLGIEPHGRDYGALNDQDYYARLADGGIVIAPPAPIFPRLELPDGRLSMFVDSHCHLNYKGLVEQERDVLERARAAGVAAMLNISTRESEWDAVIGLAEREQGVWASVGIHPHEADQHGDITSEKLIAKSQNPRVIGIGETGLDYYYDYSDRDRKKACFRQHIIAARETGLPIIVHTRDAEEDTAQILATKWSRGPIRA